MSHHCVLLACSDRYHVHFLSDCLRKAGFEVRVTHGGKAALQAICQEKPDLVMLDWDLPDLSALAITRQVRSEIQVARTPIIVIGRQVSEADRIIALESGVDLCLTETFHPAVFIARVRALLRRVQVQDALCS